MTTAQTALHVALKEVLVLFHVADLYSIGNLRCGIIIGQDHFTVGSGALLPERKLVEVLVVFSRARLLHLFLRLQSLLHLDLEASHGVLFVLPRVQLASDAQLVTRIVALDAEDHEKVRFDGLGDIVIGQMNRL